MEHPIPPQLHLPQRTDPEAGCMRHVCQAVLWLGDSRIAHTQPSTDPIPQEELEKGLPKGRDRDSRITLHEFRLQRY